MSGNQQPSNCSYNAMLVDKMNVLRYERRNALKLARHVMNWNCRRSVRCINVKNLFNKSPREVYAFHRCMSIKCEHSGASVNEGETIYTVCRIIAFELIKFWDVLLSQICVSFFTLHYIYFRTFFEWI